MSAILCFAFNDGQATNTLLQVLVALKTLPESTGVHVFEELVTFVFGAQLGIWR